MKFDSSTSARLTIAELTAIQRRAADKALARASAPSPDDVLLAARELLGDARLAAIVAATQEGSEVAAQRIPRMGPRQLEFEHE